MANVAVRIDKKDKKDKNRSQQMLPTCHTFTSGFWLRQRAVQPSFLLSRLLLVSIHKHPLNLVKSSSEGFKCSNDDENNASNFT